MFEFAHQPTFLPALGGFLGGAILLSFIFGIRGRLARANARADERVTEEKIANLKSEKSALETEVATLRSSEARFIKHQGELEALTTNDEKRVKELTRLLETTRKNLQGEIKASERALLKAVKSLEVLASPPAPPPLPSSHAPPPLPSVELAPFAPPSEPDDAGAATTPAEEDLDFVPMEDHPASSDKPSPDRPTAFEGFAEDQTAAKAESAANAFRAALKEKK